METKLSSSKVNKMSNIMVSYKFSIAPDTLIKV